MTETRTRTIEWHDPAASVAQLEGRTGLEFLQRMVSGEVPQPPMARTLGFALVAVEPGFARFEGEAAEYQYNPMGTVHGGLACTLLDSALGCSVMTTLDDKTAYTTAQVAVHLTRAITAGARLVAEARVVHRGGRVATAEAKLLDGEGALLAHATTTCVIMPRQK